MDVRNLRSRLEQLKGKKALLKSQLKDERNRLLNNETKLHLHEKARQIIKEVAQATQEQITFHVSDVTTLAMESVFNDPYQLEIEFVQRRNKMECDLFFVRGDEKINPLDASGGGAVDVASFALRIASWSLSQPNISKTIILDEPMRFLSGNYQEKASTMLKELSRQLGIQFIIVTHETILTSYADNVFEVGIKKGISKVINS